MRGDQIDQIQDKCIDVALMYDVLEHLEKPSEIMIKVYTKLRCGGLLILRAPWGDTFFGKHPDHNLRLPENGNG